PKPIWDWHHLEPQSIQRDGVDTTHMACLSWLPGADLVLSGLARGGVVPLRAPPPGPRRQAGEGHRPRRRRQDDRHPAGPLPGQQALPAPGRVRPPGSGRCAGPAADHGADTPRRDPGGDAAPGPATAGDRALVDPAAGWLLTSPGTTNGSTLSTRTGRSIPLSPPGLPREKTRPP